MEVMTRVYETNDTDKLQKSIADTFVAMGYRTDKAEWKKTLTTSQMNGKKSVQSSVYDYKSAHLNNSGINCGKLGTVEIWRPNNDKDAHVVRLGSMELTCYHSIGKYSAGVDRDVTTYQKFFDELSRISGLEAKPVKYSYK
jgi:hypothetical protein